MELIKPDIAFKRELSRLSGSQLNQCMQCGNCSAVCSLAPAERPFPRKEMIWSAWGIREKLMGNVDVWLCHQCGDCSTSCPRDVKPADVIAAVRQQTYLHYARPHWMGKLLSDPAWLPVAIALPVVVIVVILMLAGTFRIPEGPVDYSAFFPHGWLNGSISVITLFFYGLAFRGLRKFWQDMQQQFPAETGQKRGLSLVMVLGEVLSHSSFSGCEGKPVRKIAHMMLFFGFGLLILTTAYAIYATISHHYPLTLNNPFKMMANLASLMIFTGLGIMVSQRLLNRRVFGRSGYSDWLLLASIGLLTLSGLVVELARFGNWTLAYHLYFFHLVCVWFVIIYLPYSKMGHIFFRTTALIYARRIGRK